MNIHELYNLVGEREEIDYLTIKHFLRDYAQPREKIQTWLRNKELIRVKKGLYVFGAKVSRGSYCIEVLANLIYGPSAISLEYALSYYNLIPERVNLVTCITPNRNKMFSTPIGAFQYNYLSILKYPAGILQIAITKIHNVLMASPEKALSDMLILRAPRFSTIDKLKIYLLEDLRIYEKGLYNFNLLQEISHSYNNHNVLLLLNFLWSKDFFIAVASKVKFK